MTPQEARDALYAGQAVKLTVEPGHVLIVYGCDGMIYHDVVSGWSRGIVEPVTDMDGDDGFLLGYLAKNEGLELSALNPREEMGASL